MSALLLVAGWLLVGCGPDPVAFTGLQDAPELLSTFALFAGDPAEQAPAAGVIPYDITTPLFSDYADKLRFVRLPEGPPARYDPSDSFAFPVGTLLVKTFAVSDAGLEGGRRLLETRILARLESGWIGLPYVWNEEQTEAELRIAGARLEVPLEAARVDGDTGYLVPNANQCKGCHEATAEGIGPLGPKARYMNRDFAYDHGSENQLAYWARVGALEGAPVPATAPTTPIWDDPATGSLDARARAYL
ncbi:MAG: hypothetical protein R3190_15450, partial [Thermoanaerobaculia bacterium]|nr:hypothetical protein [Thermoanaerobaculia bacterium]